jgi:hypothetical protein
MDFSTSGRSTEEMKEMFRMRQLGEGSGDDSEEARDDWEDNKYLLSCFVRQNTKLTWKKLSYGSSYSPVILMSSNTDCAKGLVASTCDGPVSKGRSKYKNTHVERR